MRFIFLLLLILVAGCEQSSAPKQDAPAAAPEAEAEPDGKLDRSHAGSAAPTTVFEDPEGNEVRLQDFAGKPLLLNFWATWCGPCVVEMPTLDDLAAREGDRLNVLAVSEDRDGRSKVEAFFEKQGFKHLEPYLDPELELLAHVKGDTLPTTILYDSKGREVWRIVGMEEWTGPRAAGLIAEAR